MSNLSTKPQVDDTSRRYLATAPAGPRTEVLTAAAILQVRELPVAGEPAYGRSTPVAELEPASRLVRQIMYQDRDLSAFVARKIVHYVNVIVQDFMREGNVTGNIDTLLASVGLRKTSGQGFELQVLDPCDFSGAEGGDAVALGDIAFAVYRALMLGREAPEAYRFCVELYTGAPDKDVEEVAYDIVAWMAVALARLLNTDRIRPGLVTFGAAYKNVPAMRGAGWYPNPPRSGPMVGGDATVQRYWDATAWTDQVRIRQGNRWKIDVHSLHSVPVD